MGLLMDARHDRRTILGGCGLKIAAMLVTLGVIGAPAGADAQQFGLNMGESVAQIKAKGVVLEKISPGNWRTSYLPYGNKAFDDYGLKISPKYGLCNIEAWIPEIPDSSYGDNTKSKFLSLKQALVQRYGLPTSEFDFLKADAIWKAPNEWVWSLFKDERVLLVYWARENAPTKKLVKYILLSAQGASPEIARISVSYEFENIQTCLDDIKKFDASNL